MIRAALYTRVSTRDHGQDTENQAIRLREFVAANGWLLVDEFKDQASGKTSTRDEFQAMMESASRREVDVIVAWSLDRLTREGVAETFRHIKTLKGYGVDFISYTEPHFRTMGPAGELMIAIAAWIAQQERERMVARVNAGLERYKRDLTAGKAQSKSGKNLRPGRPCTVVDAQKVLAMREAGVPWRKLADELGVATAVAQRALARLIERRAER